MKQYQIDITDPYATTHPVEALGFPYDYAPGCGDHHIDPFRDRDGQPCAPEYWGFRPLEMGGGLWGYELIHAGDHQESFYLTTPEIGSDLPSTNNWALSCYPPCSSDGFGQADHGQDLPLWIVTVEPHRPEATLRVYPHYSTLRNGEYQR